MKRLAILGTAALASMCMCGMAYADTYVPSRTISLVYDDSGSMSNLGTIQSPTCVDTWSQARYAMEIMASMLDERDQLNIYYMSDYETSQDAPPRLRLKGSRDAHEIEQNVERVHQTLTRAGETPFNSVRKAYKDLAHTASDENWLVVLTDGEFQGVNGRIEDEFHKYTKNRRVKVMMLAMGEQASLIESDEENGIYFEHAVTSKQIRSKLTKLTNRIFQRNALPQKNVATVSFDVPMRELIVFAQGKDVSITSLSTEGKTVTPSSNIHAMYSKQAAEPRPTCNVFDESLNGKVATFDGDFDAGTYTINLTGSPDSIEVYYKPNVDVQMYFYDGVGKDVTDKAKLSNGKYRVGFGFVKAGTKDAVPASPLLGNAEYTAKLVNNDAEPVTVHDGDVITISEGTLVGDFEATFLKYNQVHTQLAPRTIFFTNELVWQVASQAQPLVLTADGVKSGNGDLTAHVRMKNNEGSVSELTDAQWQAVESVDAVEILPPPDKPQKSHRHKKKPKEQPKRFVFQANKGAANGDVALDAVSQGDPMMLCMPKAWSITKAFKIWRGIDICENEKFVYRACTEFAMGESTAYGCSEDTQVQVKNGLSGFSFVLRFFQDWWGMLVALFLIFGWVKKHWMPAIDRRVKIQMKSQNFTTRDQETSGRYQRCWLNFLPYRDSTGTVSLGGSVKADVPKTLELRSLGGHSVKLTNASKFAGNKQITFNSKEVDESYSVKAGKKRAKRPFKFSTESPIVIKSKDFTYSFVLHSKKLRRRK